MAWYKNLSQLEYIFLASFFILYLLYFVRMAIIARKTRTNINRVFFKFFIRSIYFILLIVALLGPSFGEIKKDIKSIGKDIYIAIDLSASMDAYDVSPSRLEKAKHELRDLIKSLNSDRIGLIIFSGEAFLHCPLTYDQNALNLFIETLRSNLLNGGSTNLMAPLTLALDKHMEQAQKDEKGIKNNNNKLIVLISDGENFEEGNQKVLRKLKNNEIKVFTLGIGTDKGSKIPVKNGFKKDQDNHTVITKINRSSLMNIASQTEGEYFEINKLENQTDRLINSIERIKGTLIDEKKMDVSANKYFYFLLCALFFIIMDILITVNTIKI